MLELYKTVRQLGVEEVVIRKSRFIGEALPIETEADAAQFVEQARKRHPGATHYCYAYVLGERDQIQKQSDDGEPSGTAGRPILEAIKQQKLKNVVVVVTRYFGGIMLGAGGLIRAYADGAVAGLAAAVPIFRALHREVRIVVDYSWHGKVEHELRLKGFSGEPQFAERVTVVCYPLAADAERFAAWLVDITQGQGEVRSGEVLYLEHPEPPAAFA